MNTVLIVNPEGVAVSRVLPPCGNLPSGWSYMEDDGRDLRPPPDPSPAIRIITIAAFIERFTDDEWAAVRANKTMAREFDIKAASNGGINLGSDRVRALAGIAVKLGILTTARAAALLTDGTAEEAYTE